MNTRFCSSNQPLRMDSPIRSNIRPYRIFASAVIRRKPGSVNKTLHLVRQGAGVSNIEVTDGNIKSFERVARKYGVDSGKSTLLNVIGALDSVTSGRVWIDGQDIFSMPEKKLTVFRRQHIGFIFQSFNLIPELNVEQNITFPLLLDYKKPNQKFVNELLQVLGLSERRKHLPSQLSGGQQQRVAIGRALVTRPALIMADEPTGNLDSKNSQEVLALLQTMSDRYQQTILMITHNKNHASAADRVFRMTDGVLKDLGVSSR